MKKYLIDYKEVVIFYLTLILSIIVIYIRLSYLNA